MTAQHSHPSISVSAVVLLSDEGQIALVRKHGTTAFIFPGGKPEPGETGDHTAVREVAEELGVVLEIGDLVDLGEFTTPAANEADTALHSRLYATKLPPKANVQAQAEIAELLWVTPGQVSLADGYRLAPLSSMILQALADGDLALERQALEMSLEEFEHLVGEELDALPEDMVEGLDNVVFAVEDRPDDGSLDVLGVYEGFDLPGRADYGYMQLPDRIVLFREPLLDTCHDETHLREEVRVTLIHEIAHYYGIDDAQLHELGWA